VEASIPAVALQRPGDERHDATLRKSKAPTVWEQLVGIYTEPSALFQRLAKTPTWGEALWIMIVVGWFMMTFWGLKVDVDALQRPILERNTQISASQIDQAIEVSRRFILPMGFFSVIIRNLLGVLSLGLVFWLFAMSTEESIKPSYLHAVSAATVPNLICVPYTLMISVVCMSKTVGAQIPERLAPSGLAYYIRPENPRLYALAAQLDPFVIAYFIMVFLALRHTMRLKSSEAAMCTALAVFLVIGWKVYFWV
jgi:hypothetical protein